MILSDRLSAKVLHFLNLCLESEDGLDQNAGIDTAAHLRSLGTAPVIINRRDAIRARRGIPPRSRPSQDNGNLVPGRGSQGAGRKAKPRQPASRRTKGCARAGAASATPTPLSLAPPERSAANALDGRRAGEVCPARETGAARARPDVDPEAMPLQNMPLPNMRLPKKKTAGTSRAPLPASLRWRRLALCPRLAGAGQHRSLALAPALAAVSS